MRDITRIPRIMKKLETLWNCYPDMRFWQVISVLEIPEEYQRTDPFFWEEDVWEAMIDAALKEAGQNG